MCIYIYIHNYTLYVYICTIRSHELIRGTWRYNNLALTKHGDLTKKYWDLQLVFENAKLVQITRITRPCVYGNETTIVR